VTVDHKYLELAVKFCHQQLLTPLEQHRDKLTGLHANTKIPKVIGFERIAELNKDTAYSSAARFFWQSVVHNRTISIGGNSVREHFNPSDNFSSMLESEQGPETCNSNNMLKLSKMLFIDEGKPEYIDFYERLLYNHILSSQNQNAGGFVYFTPIHPQHYRVYSTADESFWCCVGTGMENHGKYGELIYTYKGNNPYVNLFIPSVLHWKQAGITLTQQNNFPDQEQTFLTVETNAPKRFTLYIRKPYWVKDNSFAVKVNGKTVANIIYSGQYAGVNRLWHAGDKITVDLPMKTYQERLPDQSAWVSFIHGPIVLAATTDTTDMPGLFANDSRWGHIAGGPLYALAKSPLLIETGINPASQLKKTDSRDMEFTLGTLIEQPKFKNLKLIPFYRVQNTRYMLYWPITSKDSVQYKEKEFAALDEYYLKLAPRTIDQISLGEQQSENDHQLQSENSQTGLMHNTHWRSATRYVNFQMRLSPVAKFLRISYYAKDKNRSFDVLINKVKIAHIVLDGTGVDDFISTEYPLPAAAANINGTIHVEFVGTDGQSTAAIAEVRVLR
jgi:DUF1680 family protein